ncbi:MAG: hypothetical protein LBS01_10800 [Prevotellaceae bacterium]|jgi:hypothetical protein|nr:hypothetical protein [Prevotellaceae bacterium]
MTKNERIKKIREYYCSDVNKEFAEKMQTNPNATTNWVRNGYSVGDGVLYKILEKFPQINKDWLFEDKGEMLKNNQQVGNIENSTAVGVNVFGNNNSFKIPEEDIKKSIRQYQDTIKKQQEQMEKCQEQIDKLLVIIQNLSSNGK